MSTAEPAEPVLVEGPVSIARQHGEACFHCGAVAKTLYADGSITLPGSDHVWPVVTCGCRRQTPAPIRPVPSTVGLSEAQLRGTACVWCKAPLSNATAVDLSPKRRRLLDRITEWFPRACPPCAADGGQR